MQKQVDRLVKLFKTTKRRRSEKEKTRRVEKAVKVMLDRLESRITFSTDCKGDEVNDCVYIGIHDVPGTDQEVEDAVNQLNALKHIEASIIRPTGSTICVRLLPWDGDQHD